MVPFLKWPGGKRWFVSRYGGLLPTYYGRYIEPFLGSGAVFFHLQPRQATLGDMNADLIAAYRGIRENWPAVASLLECHQRRHTADYYYRVRRQEPSDPAEQAARLIYLNRTCFNGIYRVNLSGKFNVPKGTKSSVVLETDGFRSIARLLRGADLRVSDFESLIEEAGQGDLVFADPPYTVRHNLNSFVKYNEKLFSWSDQIRLANALDRARQRGAKVVLTNADHRSVNCRRQQSRTTDLRH